MLRVTSYQSLPNRRRYKLLTSMREDGWTNELLAALLPEHDAEVRQAQRQEPLFLYLRRRVNQAQQQPVFLQGRQLPCRWCSTLFTPPSQRLGAAGYCSHICQRAQNQQRKATRPPRGLLSLHSGEWSY